jgi:hypothetical protein
MRDFSTGIIVAYTGYSTEARIVRMTQGIAARYEAGCREAKAKERLCPLLMTTSLH